MKLASLFLLLTAAIRAQGVRMNPQQERQGLELPAVLVEAEARYLLGFPLIVAVTFDNTSSDVRFFDLPAIDLLYSHGMLALRLEPLKEGAPLAVRASQFRTGRPTAALGPGEQRRGLLDLSNFGLSITPGRYRLIVELHVTRYHRASRPVEIEFVAPSDRDAQEAARLRRLGNSPTDTGTWSPFLEKNWNTVKPGPLSPEAQRQLALHLFLHRAIYAPEPLVKLDVAPLRATASPIWKAEAAVLEFEIQAARDHAAAERALAPAMRTEYPTMRYRIEEVLRGEGFLTTYRRAYGAEREFARPPANYPYRDE